MNMMIYYNWSRFLRYYAGVAMVSLGMNAGMAAAEAESPSVATPEYSMEAVELLFNKMELPFEASSDPVFHRRVKAYMLDGRNYSDRMLMRMAMYFPYIEAQLEKRGLPAELKYLTVTESAVNPNARSRAGAVGLWQIMAGTARHLGLRVGRVVDERRDPKRSTEAALDYLEELFQKYSDWKLALAAYNCGPGRVDQAIRRSGSRDFEELKRFLPVETRHYIPSFMAATYFGTYYAQHGILALPEDYDLVLTDVIRIYETINFSTLSQLTGVPSDLIAKLNPAYRAGYVPANNAGYDVILPLWAVQAFELGKSSELNKADASLKRVFEGYIESSYETEDFYTWNELGNKLFLNPYHLKYLNLHLGNLESIPPSTEIRFVVPKFSGFLVKEMEGEEWWYDMSQLEPLRKKSLGNVSSRNTNPFDFPLPFLLKKAEASTSGTRIRKIYSNRNVPGRGQSLSDAERVENFNANRTQAWKAAFAGE